MVKCTSPERVCSSIAPESRHAHARRSAIRTAKAESASFGTAHGVSRCCAGCARDMRGRSFATALQGQAPKHGSGALTHRQLGVYLAQHKHNACREESVASAVRGSSALVTELSYQGVQQGVPPRYRLEFGWMHRDSGGVVLGERTVHSLCNGSTLRKNWKWMKNLVSAPFAATLRCVSFSLWVRPPRHLSTRCQRVPQHSDATCAVTRG
jgi:hypothetical protein